MKPTNEEWRELFKYALIGSVFAIAGVVVGLGLLAIIGSWLFGV
jgi:hypothetical protein